jgi:pimeloyl-ACP methyl ester carboxylesterase
MARLDPEHLLIRFLQLRGAKLQRNHCRGVGMNSFLLKPKPSRDRGEHAVLLHGIGAAATHFWWTMLALRAKGYTVHAPDLPGHGLSEDCPPPKLTGEALFETLLEWLEKAGPKKFVLVGNSLGGALAWRFAGIHPERVSKLIVISPAVGFESEEVWTEFVSSLAIKDRESCKGFLSRVFVQKAFHLDWIVPSTIHALNRPAVRDLLETTRFSDLQLQHRLGEVKVPTLLIWGRQDRLIPRSNLEFIKKIASDSVKILEPEGVGHCPQLDKALWLNRELENYLAV